MKKFIIILASVLLLTSVGANAYMDSDINIYASPTGDDIFGNGTVRKPYKSVEKVSEKVKLYMKSGTQRNINAVFRGGEYLLGERMTIDSVSKQGYTGTVTYKSYDGERAVFTGAENKLKWEPVGNGIYRAASDCEVHVLYEDGEPSVKARYPNKSEPRINGYLSAASGGTKDFLNFNVGDIPEINSDENLQICVFDGGENCLYSMNILGAEISYDENKITFSKSTAMNCVGGSKYYIQNSLELLDSPGEMYYSAAEQAVYYMPRNPEKLSDVFAPYLKQAFYISGTKEIPIDGVTVNGIDFKYFGCFSDGTVPLVYSYNANNIEISDCSFYCIGGMGMELYYTDNSRVIGNRLENIGGTGVRIRDTNDVNNESSNVISDNYIKNVGFYYASSNGIDIIRSSKNKVLNNTISGCTRAAIALGGSSQQTFARVGTEVDGVVITRDNVKPYLVSNDNIISGNDVSDCMLETNDGAVIYTWAAGYDNEISNNYIHDSGADFSWNFGAVYLDDDTNRSTVSCNYITRLGSETVNEKNVGNMRNIFFIKGQDNIIENNFVIDCNPSKGITRIDSQSGTGPVGNAVFRKNIAYGSGGSIYGFYGISKQPENPLNVKFKECNNNIYYDKSEYYDVLVRGQDDVYKKLCDISEWKNDWGFDVDSLFKKAEFTDTYTGDFRLSGNGIAENMGIAGIDISKCGVGERYKFKSDKPLSKLFLSAEGSAYSTVRINSGENVRLTAIAKSEDGVRINDIKLLFFSSDTDIVSVENGEAVAKKAGEATITAVCMAGDRLCTAELYFNIK